MVETPRAQRPPSQGAGHDPAEVPKELQRWYDGKTTVTLPSGRRITPCNLCFLKYNSDAFQGRVVTTPDGSVVNDIYWFGNAAGMFGDFRNPGLNNWNMSIERTFWQKENLSVEFSAQISNIFNHTQLRPGGFFGNRSLGSTSVRVNSPQNIQTGQGTNDDFGTRSVLIPGR